MRMTQILVAYGTRYGSTREVAEAVAATLEEQGVDTDVKQAKQVRSLDGYDAVVLGTPLYMGALHKDVRALLEKNRAALEHTPLRALRPRPDQGRRRPRRLARAAHRRAGQAAGADSGLHGRLRRRLRPGAARLQGQDDRRPAGVAAARRGRARRPGLGGRFAPGRELGELIDSGPCRRSVPLPAACRPAAGAGYAAGSSLKSTTECGMETLLVPC